MMPHPNFIPMPNSTTPVWQQFQDYENSKFWYSGGGAVLAVTITAFLIITTAWLVIPWYYRRKENKK